MKVPVGIQNAINEVFRLRKEIEMLKTQEAGLADTVKTYMEKGNLRVIETDNVSAEYAERPRMIPDPDKLYDAVEEDWNKFIRCVSVGLDSNKKKGVIGAREYLGEEDIKKISKIEMTQVLSVKAIAQETKPAEAPAQQKKGRKATA